MDTKKILQVVLTLVVVGSLALMAGSILSAADDASMRRPAPAAPAAGDPASQPPS